jgi:hypothetical protein
MFKTLNANITQKKILKFKLWNEYLTQQPDRRRHGAYLNVCIYVQSREHKYHNIKVLKLLFFITFVFIFAALSVTTVEILFVKFQSTTMFLNSFAKLIEVWVSSIFNGIQNTGDHLNFCG